MYWTVFQFSTIRRFSNWSQAFVFRQFFKQCIRLVVVWSTLFSIVRRYKTLDTRISFSCRKKFRISQSNTGMSNPRPAILSHAALQRFYILTFKNSTYIFRRFFNSISINECFISPIFYTKFYTISFHA